MAAEIRRRSLGNPENNVGVTACLSAGRRNLAKLCGCRRIWRIDCRRSRNGRLCSGWRWHIAIENGETWRWRLANEPGVANGVMAKLSAWLAYRKR
jgi:hypothetical protein